MQPDFEVARMVLHCFGVRNDNEAACRGGSWAASFASIGKGRFHVGPHLVALVDLFKCGHGHTVANAREKRYNSTVWVPTNVLSLCSAAYF